jgi:hypothetical protein
MRVAMWFNARSKPGDDSFSFVESATMYDCGVHECEAVFFDGILLLGGSKYPPAKPGALEFWPLKAA